MTDHHSPAAPESTTARPAVCQIGDWRFDPEACTLSRGGDVRRLEDRAARTLVLLCRRRGETVTQDDILAEVWGGRAISPNSVAVVMRDLRRALDDDARNPRCIVTVPKRGYRLLAEGPAAVIVDAPSPGRSDWVVLGVALVATVGAMAARPAEPGPTVIAIEATRNDTGAASYGPLALALGELVTGDLADSEGVKVIAADAAPARARAADLRLSSTLILWNGRPTLSLSAVDPSTGAVAWAGMAQGPADALAGNTLRELAGFEARLAASEGEVKAR